MPIVNNSKFYVLGVNQNTKQVYIVCSWDEDAKRSLNCSYERKGRR